MPRCDWLRTGPRNRPCTGPRAPARRRVARAAAERPTVARYSDRRQPGALRMAGGIGSGIRGATAANARAAAQPASAQRGEVLISKQKVWRAGLRHQGYP